MIFSILLLYLYQSINISKNKNEFYLNFYEKTSNYDKVKNLIYHDIFQIISFDINVSRHDSYDTFIFKSKNSLHNLSSPNITYLMQDNTLYRLESIKKAKLPIKYDDLKNYKFNILLKNTQEFRVFDKNNSFIFYIKEDKEHIFNIKLPSISKDINITKKDENKSKGKN